MNWLFLALRHVGLLLSLWEIQSFQDRWFPRRSVDLRQKTQTRITRTKFPSKKELDMFLCPVLTKKKRAWATVYHRGRCTAPTRSPGPTTVSRLHEDLQVNDSAGWRRQGTRAYTPWTRRHDDPRLRDRLSTSKLGKILKQKNIKKNLLAPHSPACWLVQKSGNAHYLKMLLFSTMW